MCVCVRRRFANGDPIDPSGGDIGDPPLRCDGYVRNSWGFIGAESDQVCMHASGGLWWPLVASGGLWWPLVASGGLWRPLVSL